MIADSALQGAGRLPPGQPAPAEVHPQLLLFSGCPHPSQAGGYLQSPRSGGTISQNNLGVLMSDRCMGHPGCAYPPQAGEATFDALILDIQLSGLSLMALKTRI
jgi:hypothetical protein